jgi:hypothetical protein
MDAPAETDVCEHQPELALIRRDARGLYVLLFCRLCNAEGKVYLGENIEWQEEERHGPDLHPP